MKTYQAKIKSPYFTPLFGNVRCGEFFFYKSQLCVRTGANDPAEWEAFNFAQNEKFHIPHTARVSIVDCEITYQYHILTEAEK